MILLQGAPERVDYLQFSPNGRTLVAPSSGGAQVWNDVTAGGPPSILLGYPDLKAARFTPDGQKLLLGGFRTRPILHDFLTGEAAEVPLELPDEGVYWDLDPDGEFLIAAQIDYGRKPPGRLFSRPLADLGSSVWSLDTSHLIHAPPLFLAGGERFVLFEWRWEVPPANGRSYVTRDARTGQVLAEVEATGDEFNSPVMSADRSMVASLKDSRIAVFHAQDFKAEPVMIRNDGRKKFTGLAFHPSGRFLDATSNDATVKLYDTTTWAVAARFDWDIGKLRSVAFSPDGMLAAAGGDKGKIVVWDVDL